MAAAHPTKQLPIRRRSLSEPNLSASTICSVLNGSPKPAQSANRVRIRYQDDALRLRSQTNSRQLIQSALDDTSQLSNSARIAKKALKYRKILDRMADVDVNDPAFDASDFLGVDWCKTIIATNVPEYVDAEMASRQVPPGEWIPS